ncbi:methionyl-tRNA formyltransferase [Pedobacter sp. ok626]|uniref:methionyl-tRNA formyltransferase n=1 Tax=Pedobacter sp. ok626 TaxID=1761882 RepID=UPI0008854C09|nr:formyltransferase family protein [Pedobacter sp. ok626]SDL79412.1 methionyl-tRNA formyltransferase [Pedobacter sp. ok626]
MTNEVLLSPMKAIVFTNSSLFLKTANSLAGHVKIVGIAISDQLNYETELTIEWAATQQIPLFIVNKQDLTKGNELENWMADLTANVALVLTFPYKIPQNILNIPQLGFFNFHFSMLPAYKGAAPLFWQLKNGEQGAGLSVHKMTVVVDEGPLVFNQYLSLMAGENYGIAYSRLTQLIMQSIPEIINRISTGHYIEINSDHQESYFGIPKVSDLTINWENHSAAEIENLVNAANPLYQGAITYLGTESIRILEVSPVDGDFNPGTATVGSIFHVDPHHGPMVLTSNKQLLLLNIVSTSDGIFSGKKIYAMGLKAGEQLGESKLNLKI